jgi:phage gpG-like protein
MSITISEKWNGEEVKIMGKKVINKSIYEIGLIVEGQAKLLAPKNWGYLAASITTQAIDKGTEPESPGKYAEKKKGLDPGMPVNMKIKKPNDVNEVLIGTPVEYGPYQEFGTIRMDARPFLRPSLDLARGKVLTVSMNAGRMEFKEYLKPTGTGGT